MVFEFEGLRVATGAVNLAALGTASSNALVLLLLDTQHYGILNAQIFYGLWLVPLGYLAYKSAGWFPKWLGVLLVVGGVCYLVDMLALFLVAMLAAIKIVRPAFEAFYATMTEEQKARLDSVGPRRWGWHWRWNG